MNMLKVVIRRKLEYTNTNGIELFWMKHIILKVELFRHLKQHMKYLVYIDGVLQVHQFKIVRLISSLYFILLSIRLGLSLHAGIDL